MRYDVHKTKTAMRETIIYDVNKWQRKHLQPTTKINWMWISVCVFGRSMRDIIYSRRKRKKGAETRFREFRLMRCMPQQRLAVNGRCRCCCRRPTSLSIINVMNFRSLNHHQVTSNWMNWKTMAFHIFHTLNFTAHRINRVKQKIYHDWNDVVSFALLLLLLLFHWWQNIKMFAANAYS